MVKMSDEVKEFLLNGLSESDKVTATLIINEAEKNDVDSYQIKLSNRVYDIKNGQIAGSTVF